jgi:hypothetical protein
MPLMNIFEPLFILLFLATFVTLCTVTVVALRGQRGRAVKILRRLAICAVAYFAIVLLVALVTPQKVYHIGDRRCFDDWCMAVVAAKRTPLPDTASWDVTLRLSSRARRVTQREKGVVVYLTDARRRRFDPVPGEATVPLDTQLAPGESVDAARRFELPPDATDVGLIFAHEGGFPIGTFIISENEWFHRAAIVRFDER